MSLNIKTDETCRLHETAVTAAPNYRMSVANVLEVSIVVGRSRRRRVTLPGYRNKVYKHSAGRYV